MIPGLGDIQRAGRTVLHEAGRQIALSVTVGVLGGIAAVFACAGLFLALAPMWGPSYAAFATAGAAAIVALVCVAAMGKRSPPPPPPPPRPAPGTGTPETLPLVVVAGFLEGFLASRSARDPRAAPGNDKPTDKPTPD